jgi:hypothetical protein
VVVLAVDSCVGSTAEGGVHLPDLKPPRFTSDESQTLVTFLDYVRESMMRKLDGLSGADARRELVPSGTSLLSLVQHQTTAEVNWFQIRFAGLQDREPAAATGECHAVSEHLARYRAVVERDNEIVARAPSLEQPCAADDYADVDLRWVLVHMIEETARHAGHADIIREQIDGVTGR